MNKQLKGFFITSTGATMWGLNAVAGKYVMGVKGVDPVWMVTLRLILAGIILLGTAMIKADAKDASGIAVFRVKVRKVFAIWQDKKSAGRLLVIAVFAFATCQVSYFAAINLANAGIATAIQQTAPVFVLLSVLVLEKRLPKPMEVVVLVTVIFGAFMLATGGNWKTLIVPVNALILAIISSITCAMYTVMPGKLIKKYGTFAAIGWGMLLAGIVMIPVAKLWEVSGTWDIGTVAVFGFVIIFGTVVAFAAFLYGITIVGPLTGSILGLIEPVVAAMASAILLKQTFLVTDIIGIVAILAGVAMLSIYNERK